MTKVEIEPGPGLPKTYHIQVEQPTTVPQPINQSSMPPVALVEIETATELIAGPVGPPGPEGPVGPQGEPGSPDTPADILAKLVTVDGVDSGLDADMLDGQHASYFASQVDLSNLTTRVTAAEGVNTSQDAAIAGKVDAVAQDARDDSQDAAIAGKIGEAPSDGLQYVRKNAAWAVAAFPPGTHVGTTPPASPVPGQLWFESDSGDTFIWYDDGNSAQWVQQNVVADSFPEAPINGTTYGRKDAAWAAIAGFPEAPTDGQQYVRQMAAWAPVDVPPGTLMQDTPPSSPDPGQLWWETDTGRLFIWYVDANSSQWVHINPSAGGAEVPLGQCYLEWSGANLSLRREGGTRLWINGRNEVIPVAGVTLAATGLTMTGGIAASAIYYIYAAASGGVITLEASATAWVVDATTGLRVKTGDASRTLVGLAGLSAAATWWTGNNCGVCSWFNPRWRRMQTSIASQAFTGVMAGSSCYQYFVCFGDRQINLVSYARAASHTAVAQDHSMDVRLGPSQTAVWTSIFSSNAGNLTARLSSSAGNASQFFFSNILLDKTFAPTIDGQYLHQIYCATSSATATFYGLTVDTCTWG